MPGGLLNCPLEYFDLSANKFHSNNQPSKSFDWQAKRSPLRLLHLASEIVLKKKFYYAPNIIPYTVVEFLDNVNVCVCGKLAVDDGLYLYRLYNMEHYKVVIFDDNNQNNIVGFDCYFCSLKCMRTSR